MAPDVMVIPRSEPFLGREMASEEQTEFVGYRGRWAEDQHPSRILLERSEDKHRLGELYDRMLERDSDLAAFVDKRLDAALTLPRRIVPDGSTPEALKAAELCKAALGEIPNLSSFYRHQLMATFKGVAHDELIWKRQRRGPLKGYLVPVDARDRPMWRFAYRQRQLHVRRAAAEPVPAHPAKVVAWTRGTKDSGWGDPLLDKVYWYHYIKLHAWKYFAVAVEKWAQPTVKGQYPHDPGTSDTAKKTNEARQAALLEVLESIQSEQAIVFPEDLKVDLIEATRSGTISYEQFIALCTRGEAVLILGEVDTSGMAKGPGSFAKSVISNEVRIEKVRLDAHDLSAHIRDNLLKLIVRINLGPDVPIPYLEIDVMEAEDRELRQKGIAAVLDRGLAVPESYFYSAHQVPIPKPGERVITAPTPITENRPSDEASPRDEDTAPDAPVDTDDESEDLEEAA